MDLLVTFETVSAALEGELLVKDMGIPCRIIPVPRALSASCGYALSVEAGDAGEFCGGLRDRGVSFVRVFRRGALPGKGGGYELLAGSGMPDGAELNGGRGGTERCGGRHG
jgi:hypothetical protein